MKGLLAVLGVVVVGAAAYFIAKGNGPTNTSGKSGSGGSGVPTGSAAQQIQKQVAGNLITSANMASLGGLLTSILPSGGAAKPATPAGNGSGFVTERDLKPTPSLGADPGGEVGPPAPALSASFTTDADIEG